MGLYIFTKYLHRIEYGAVKSGKELQWFKGINKLKKKLSQMEK